MAYENLLKSVEESAREREQEFRKNAERVAQEIRSDAKRDAEAMQERAVRDAQRSAAIERNKELYLVKSEIKENALRGREKLFDTAFEEAGRQLAHLREDATYPEVFSRLAREAAGAMGGVPFRVHADPRDRDLCSRTLEGLGIRCEILTDIETAGGLVVSTPDNLVVIANTIESRLERARERRRLEVHAILSGG